MSAKGWIMVRELPEGDFLKSLGKVIFRNLGTCVVPLVITSAKDGWIVKVGVVRQKLISTKKETRLIFQIHEINEPVFVRVEDGHRYLQFHEDWRMKSTMNRKVYHLPNWNSSVGESKP